MSKELNTLIYRKANEKDARAITDLVAQFCTDFFVHPNGKGAEEFLESVSEKAEISYLNDARYHYLLALDQGELAGFIALRDMSHIFHLFVNPAYQGMGLARELWQRILAQTNEHAYSSVFTVNSSVKAIPVYEKFGFARSEEILEVHGISFMPMHLQQQQQNHQTTA